METQVIMVFKEESQDMAISDLTLESLTWHDVESKLYKAMASLNAFDLRDENFEFVCCPYPPNIEGARCIVCSFVLANSS